MAFFVFRRFFVFRVQNILWFEKQFQVTTDFLPSAFDSYDNRKDHDTYLVSATLGPDDGRHIFTYLNVLLTYIVPHDLAIGMQQKGSHPSAPNCTKFSKFY